jgi:hypothetical protein
MMVTQIQKSPGMKNARTIYLDFPAGKAFNEDQNFSSYLVHSISPKSHAFSTTLLPHSLV